MPSVPPSDRKGLSANERRNPSDAGVENEAEGRVLGYSVVAIVGVVAGIVIGSLLAPHGAPRPSVSEPAAPHPRALESPP